MIRWNFLNLKIEFGSYFFLKCISSFKENFKFGFFLTNQEEVFRPVKFKVIELKKKENSCLDKSGESDRLRKVVIEGMTCQARNHRAQILAVRSQTHLQLVKQNLYLAADQKTILPKKGCKWSKNWFGTVKNASPFYVEKQTITYKGRRLWSEVFSTKKDH